MPRCILNVTPETHTRSTRGDRIFFRIPREKLYPSGLARLKRLEKYNNYKINLLTEAKRKKFEIPPVGLSVTFYLPVPKSWSKKKREAYHGAYHQNRIDIDNLGKGFFDALVAEDKFIANVTLTKKWVNFEKGWIECEWSDNPQDYKQLVEIPLRELES